MGIFNQLDFIRDEIKDIPNINQKPSGSIRSFTGRIGYAISLGLKEKEIFVFGLLQWFSIAFAYFLWIQMLGWIPEETWQAASESDGSANVYWILLLWSFFCVGLAAFPVGILTGCMGATHFLNKQGQESTIPKCLNLVLPRSWSLWAFHWLDGWITINQIIERLPSKKHPKTPAQKALSEALYYAWKLGISGVLPSIVTGNNLFTSGKNSVIFVKDNFIDAAKLRTGYSALCWVVGIAAYFGTIGIFNLIDIAPESDEVYGHIYTYYFWAAVPLLSALAVVMLILRPIFVIALCDLYSDHLDKKGETVVFPEHSTKSTSAIAAFIVLCMAIAMVYFFRDQLGIVEKLSVLS